MLKLGNRFRLIVVGFLFSVFQLFVSCQKNEAKIEQEAFYEVFPIVFDSVYIDRNLFLPPPPYRNKIEKKEYDQYLKEIAEYKTDTSQRFVLIDLNKRLCLIKSNENKIRKFLQLNEQDSVYSTAQDSISIDRLITNKKIVFKKYQEIIKEKNIFCENKNSKYIVGLVSFSTIIFDKEYKHGYFQCTYSCGSKAGQGFDIYIINEGGKWKVYKIEVSWIS